jgi:hypothetical protein
MKPTTFSPAQARPRRHFVTLHMAAVTLPPQNDPLMSDPALRVVRADEVRTGDLIISAFPTTRRQHIGRADFFDGGPYLAAPQPLDPDACGCQSCQDYAMELPNVPAVVLVPAGAVWDGVCDPWDADAPVLILPAPERRLSDVSPAA